MNALELELHYPLGDSLPQPGKTLGVAPGVKWIRMTLPFALNHINLWLMRDELDGPSGKLQGWTVVDCCISRDESKAQWQQIFDTELEGLPILRVICTHMHPDHIGLAAWLCDRWTTPQHTCRLWISATDYGVARIASMSTRRSKVHDSKPSNARRVVDIAFAPGSGAAVKARGGSFRRKTIVVRNVAEVQGVFT